MATKQKIKPSRVNVASVASKSTDEYLKAAQESTAELVASGLLKPIADTSQMESVLGAVGGLAKEPHRVSSDMPSAPLTLSKDIAVGSIIEAPISRLKESDLNARRFYTAAEVDAMGNSLLENKQKAPDNKAAIGIR